MATLLFITGTIALYFVLVSLARNRVDNFRDTLTESVKTDIINLYRQFREERKQRQLSIREFEERAGHLVDRYLAKIYSSEEEVPLQHRMALHNLIHHLSIRLRRESDALTPQMEG